MQIIDNEYYYKPPKPRPKAPTKYYQPPKPKAAPPPPEWNPKDPRNRGTNVNRPPDIRNLPKPGMPPGFLNFDALNSAMAQTQTKRINQIGSFLSNLWNKVISQPDAGSPYPMDGTTAMASPTFNTSREPARGAYGMPATPNIVDRNKWQRSLENWWLPPSVREAPPNTSYMPNYPQPYTGLYTPWATVVMDKITNPTGSRMGGTSGITRMTDTIGHSMLPNKQFLPLVSKPGNKPWASNGASVPAISYVNRLQGAWNGAYLFPDIKSGYSTVNPNANMNLPMLNPRITGVWNDEHPYPNQQAGYSTQTPTYPFPIVNPEPYGDLFDNVTYEDPGGGGGGGGWGGWGGWGGGSASYGASSGVNSYLPGTRAGYGANASSPRYTGGGSGRASGYAGGQYGNQASWRMPMLVWNI